MSHCTSFSFSYTDEELAVQAFHRLGLTPTTDVISEYGSDFSKSFLSLLGYAGQRQMRAIVAATESYQYFLCREGKAYRLYLEKEDEPTQSDLADMEDMEMAFRLTYIQIALERLAKTFEDRGTPTRLVQEEDAVILQFGPSFDRSIRITTTSDGFIEEEVAGVVGSSCADITAELENLLSLETAELATQWKPEYHQQIEDEVVQVLRLQQ